MHNRILDVQDTHSQSQSAEKNKTSTLLQSKHLFPNDTTLRYYNDDIEG